MSPPTTRGGRPRLRADQRRSKPLHIHLTERELAAIKTYAEAEGRSVSEYMRQRSLTPGTERTVAVAP